MSHKEDEKVWGEPAQLKFFNHLLPRDSLPALST